MVVKEMVRFFTEMGGIKNSSINKLLLQILINMYCYLKHFLNASPTCWKLVGNR